MGAQHNLLHILKRPLLLQLLLVPNIAESTNQQRGKPLDLQVQAAKAAAGSAYSLDVISYPSLSTYTKAAPFLCTYSMVLLLARAHGVAAAATSLALAYQVAYLSTGLSSRDEVQQTVAPLVTSRCSCCRSTNAFEP